jgi:hypothetical protein
MQQVNVQLRVVNFDPYAFCHEIIRLDESGDDRIEVRAFAAYLESCQHTLEQHI